MPVNENESRPEHKLYDLTKLKEIGRGNDAFIKKMINVFADRIPSSLAEINAAFENKDYKKIRNIAHMLKPSIDNMGVTAIKNNMRDIEDLALEDPSSPLLHENITRVETVLMQVYDQLKQEVK